MANSTGPYINQLPKQIAAGRRPITPPPLAGLNQPSFTAAPMKDARQHFIDTRNDFRSVRDDFLALPHSRERNAALPQYEIERDYFRDTRDWMNGLTKGTNPNVWPDAPDQPLQIMPVFRGFAGPYPGSQPPPAPNQTVQQRTMARLDGLNLPPQVLQRLKDTLNGRQLAPPTPSRQSTPPPPPVDD